MNNEIKEILNNQKLINVENDYERIIFEYLANNCSEFDDEHIKQLVNLKVEQYKQSLDYITNLQESEAYYYGYYKDYKSRNEKARGMIRFIAYNSERPLTITELNKVYNILGGDDNAINSK